MKIPTRRGPTGIKSGDQVLGLVCHNCQHAMALGGNFESADDLPETLGLQCPTCQQTDRYPKVEIQILTAHTKQ